MDITIIGIAGGSASGKTTVVKKLQERFTGEIQVLGHDNYYKAHDNMPFSERTLLNYDHPDAFETDYMVRHIMELKEGRPVEHPTYDYTVHNRAKETVFMEPRPVIVVEGILVLEDAALRNLMDLRIFVDTDAEERLARRILRDTKERGRSLESVLRKLTGLLADHCTNLVDRLVCIVDPVLSGILMLAVGLSLLSVMLPLIGMMNSMG